MRDGGWDCDVVVNDASNVNHVSDRGGATGPALRVGWRHIRGLGEKSRRALQEAHAAGPFTSTGDVIRRGSLSRADALHIARAGAFDAFDPGRRAAAWEALRAVGDVLPLAPAHPLRFRPTEVTGAERVFLDYLATGIWGVPESPVGRRVENQKLLDMSAYLDRLPAPPGAPVDRAASARGKELFRRNCTSCHNVDQSKFVPPMLVKLKTIWPAYAPVPVGLRGNKSLSQVLNSLGAYDNKMVVVDASDRGEKRGVSMPMLLDLARTKLFLHDASVPSPRVLFRGRRARSSHSSLR
jgi:hypothetical protein